MLIIFLISFEPCLLSSSAFCIRFPRLFFFKGNRYKQKIDNRFNYMVTDFLQLFFSLNIELISDISFFSFFCFCQCLTFSGSNYRAPLEIGSITISRVKFVSLFKFICAQTFTNIGWNIMISHEIYIEDW